MKTYLKIGLFLLLSVAFFLFTGDGSEALLLLILLIYLNWHFKKKEAPEEEPSALNQQNSTKLENRKI